MLARMPGTTNVPVGVFDLGATVGDRGESLEGQYPECGCPEEITQGSGLSGDREVYR